VTDLQERAEDLDTSHLVASPDRRFYAFVLDRLFGWLVIAAAAWASWTFLIDPGNTVAGIAAIAGAVVVVWFVFALATGLWGATPGKALLGLRVLSAADTRPIGVGRALLRGLVVGVATIPLGFGTAALALTAMVDPSGWRRGWHDLRADSVVVDVRPPPVGDEPEAEAPRGVVNLTAMRLVPASPTPPRRVPTRAARGAKPEPVEEPDAARTPRQGLGWPLVGDAPGAPAPVPPAPAPAAPAPAPARAPGAHAAVPPQPVQPPLPAPPAQRVPPSRPAAPASARWQVTFDTGETFEVAGLTLVGRRPEPRPGEPVKRLVALPSDDMSLSKTHAQFQVVPDGALVVMDRGSTNGSILTRGGAVKPLPGGRPQTLRDGDVVRFGDREMTVARLG
jgi:uncharacterized RDD family membrane protein YckC